MKSIYQKGFYLNPQNEEKELDFFDAAYFTLPNEYSNSEVLSVFIHDNGDHATQILVLHSLDQRIYATTYNSKYDEGGRIFENCRSDEFKFTFERNREYFSEVTTVFCLFSMLHLEYKKEFFSSGDLSGDFEAFVFNKIGVQP